MTVWLQPGHCEPDNEKGGRWKTSHEVRTRKAAGVND